MEPSGEFRIDGKIKLVHSVGIDLSSELRFKGGPVGFDIFTYDKAGKRVKGNDSNGVINKWNTTNTAPDRQGDSIHAPIFTPTVFHG